MQISRARKIASHKVHTCRTRCIRRLRFTYPVPMMVTVPFLWVGLSHTTALLPQDQVVTRPGIIEL